MEYYSVDESALLSLRAEKEWPTPPIREIQNTGKLWKLRESSKLVCFCNVNPFEFVTFFVTTRTVRDRDQCRSLDPWSSEQRLIDIFSEDERLPDDIEVRALRKFWKRRPEDVIIEFCIAS
jgi:hypothetical protein